MNKIHYLKKIVDPLIIVLGPASLASGVAAVVTGQPPKVSAALRSVWQTTVWSVSVRFVGNLTDSSPERVEWVLSVRFVVNLTDRRQNSTTPSFLWMLINIQEARRRICWMDVIMSTSTWALILVSKSGRAGIQEIYLIWAILCLIRRTPYPFNVLHV